MAEELVPRRPFGRTSESVSIMGLGGCHLGFPSQEELAL